MKFRAGILIFLLAWPLLAIEKIRTVRVDGTTYDNIQDVHVTSGGRIVILGDGGGTTVMPDKLPPGFLDSWGISEEKLAASRAALKDESEKALAAAIRAGSFREVDGVVYDLRRAQPGWRKFIDAKILQIVNGAALVDPNPLAATPVPILVRNIPSGLADNDKATFLAMSTGDFSLTNRFGYEHTVHSYDVGRICKRNDIPDIIIKGTRSVAALPFSDRPRNASEKPFLPQPSAIGEGVRGIGSGFFVTEDGFLLTNFHVVRDSEKVEVKYKSRVYEAKVVGVDKENDLALLKIPITGTPALAISPKDSVELGDAVFTIGFPNVDMQGFEPKYTDGKISSLNGMRDDPSDYQISVPVQPGNSGGPLCSAVNGEVVGIVVARLNDITALRESGAVPQNVNYAVKSRYALNLLRGVPGLDARMAEAVSKPAKPVQAVEDAIAMIMVH